MHYYQVDLFYVVLDIQLQELHNRFPETNAELLFCVACFSPRNKFCEFDKQNFIQFVQFY